MKILVILVSLLIILTPISFAKEITIPELFEVKGQVISEPTGKGVYFYAGSKLIAVNDKYQYQDRLNSNINSNSLPFGQQITSENRFSFTGKELDKDLYYFNARYYDSNLGRFTSVDPFPSEPAYQYVNNNPTNMVDSSGRFAIAIPAIGLGEAVILTAAVLTATATLIQTGSAEAAAEKFEETFVEPNKILFENLVNAPKLDATNVVPLILINILTKKGSEEDSTTGPEESSDSNPINKWLDEILEDHKRELGETGTPNGPEEDPDFDPDGSRRSSDEDIPKRLSDEYDLDKAQRGRLRDLMHKQKGPGQNHLPEQTIRELIIDNLLPPS